jgi:hypothetical protein
MMVKYFGLFILAILLAGCTPPASPTPGAITQEDYTIYGALIESSRASLVGKQIRQVVINHQTSVVLATGNLDTMLKYAQNEIPALDPSIVADFKNNNAESFNLELRIPLSFAYLLVEPDLFKHACDTPEAFHQNFPSAQGALTLSRIGFNQQKDQALVYVSTACQKTGAGYFFWMKKTDGIWKTEKQLIAWTA